MLNPLVKEALHSFGWYEGRKVPVQQWVDTLNSHHKTPANIRPFPAVVNFLEEFGGLQLNKYPSPHARYALTKVVFDPVRAGIGEMDRVQLWIEALKIQAYPIGELDYYQMVLAEDGAMYFNSAGDGQCIGRTVEEALEVLLLREKQPQSVFPGLQGG